MNLTDLDPTKLGALSDEDFTAAMAQFADIEATHRKENQIIYYQPASEAAGKVHFSTAPVVGIGGGNRACLPLDALVLMAHGGWELLGNVTVGDIVMACDPITGLAKPAPVTRTFRSGPKEVFKVKFSGGESFRATADHQVPMYLGSGTKTSKGNPMLPYKRRLGNYLDVFDKRTVSKRISAVSPIEIRTTMREKLPLHPYLLAALIGDGGLTQASPRFSCISPPLLGRIARHLADIGTVLVHRAGCDYGITNEGQTNSRQTDGYFPNRLKVALKSVGIWGLNSHNKFIPEAVFGLCREARLEFLAGLIDTDGGAHQYATVSHVLARDFVRLVRTLGGKATRANRVTVLNGKEFPYHHIYWRVNDDVPLTMPHKSVRKADREVDYRRKVCRSYKSLGMMECGDIEVDHPSHCYITENYVIVSNSKTTTALADIVAQATGVFPKWEWQQFMNRFRGPINNRIVCQSLTTVLEPTILPKLQWWKWQGIDKPGGLRGHWGFIPKDCLKNGNWSDSWSSKLRILTIHCRNPDNHDEIIGESMFQFMAITQETPEFRSGSFHNVLHDEPPTFAIWQENQARVIDVGGRLWVAMTWPDDPEIPVDWIHDEIYEQRDTPGVDWFEIWTMNNQFLDKKIIEEGSKNWSATVKAVRLKGQSIRFSNRIHPLFTDTNVTWCPACKEQATEQHGHCVTCGQETFEFNHVAEFDHEGWPAVFLLDPHPRKPHMFCWVALDASDDWYVVAEGQCDEDCAAVKKMVDDMEEEYGINTKARLMDPNMGASPASQKREISWQDEFSTAGLFCDLADNSGVGRKRFNELLKPDPYTRRPRVTVHPRCLVSIFQTKRYVWDDFKRSAEKDQKQTPRNKTDDYPTLFKYLANYQPTFMFLREGAPIIRRPGKRKKHGYQN